MKYSVFEHLSGNAITGVAYKNNLRKKRVIQHFTSKGETTIPELSELINISVPKTTELIVDLQKEGLVIDISKRADGPGRKATVYGLNEESCYFLGIEIRKYKINIGLMSFNTKIVESSVNIDFEILDSIESLEAIIGELNNFLNHSRIPKDKIIAMGVSLAGRINNTTNEILSIYHFADAPVKTKLEAAFGLPVYLDNDSRTIAYGEYHFGVEGLNYKEKAVCVVNIDYGIAVGIFINGKPLYGASGYAGELGHIPLFNNEQICYCGKKGCFETEASGLALVDFVLKKINEGSSSRLQTALSEKGFIQLEDIIEAVRYGDNLAIEGVAEIAYKIGKGLAVIINLLNPEVIILGGMLSAIGEPLLLPVKSSVLEYSLNLLNLDTKIVLSKIGSNAGLLGTCLLVRDKVLEL